MNNTVKCPKCGTIHELSIDAINEKLLKCPKCGAVLNKTPQDNIEHTQPSLTKKQKRGIIILIIIIILYLIGKNSDTSVSSQYIVTEDTYAATDEQTWNDIGLYTSSNDLQAIQSLIHQKKIIPMQKGEEVYLVSSGFSYCIVRKKGSTQRLWIDMGSIKQ